MKSNEIVREFVIPDGIGAQFWRKVYAMAYAKYNNLFFDEFPVTNFLIHESDKINSEEEKQEVIKNFYKAIDVPWPKVSKEITDNFKIHAGVGMGSIETQGTFIGSQEFLSCAKSFNNISETDNSIVIHIRRGNVVEHNPRWIDDSLYVNLLKNIQTIKDKYHMGNPEIIILTDAPDEDKTYKPINSEEALKWNQPYLHANENGEYPIKSFNFDILRNEYPNLKVVNNLGTYESFLIMLRAKVLIISRSAFSKAAGALSKNNVIALDSAYHDYFSGLSGIVDSNGNISFTQ
jgi:hypothetical protein